MDKIDKLKRSLFTTSFTFWGDLYQYSEVIRWVLKKLEATSGIVPFLFAQLQQVQLFYNS